MGKTWFDCVCVFCEGWEVRQGQRASSKLTSLFSPSRVCTDKNKQNHTQKQAIRSKPVLFHKQ